MKDTTRTINNSRGVIVIVDDVDVSRIYRRQDTKDISSGHPSDCGEWLVLPTRFTKNPEMVRLFIECYEAGHKQGWIDGEWSLRKAFYRVVGHPN